MSRNGNGTYNLPAGNPVVTGTVISSTWANNTLADMANAITGSIAADGQTPITGALKGTNGTVSFAGVGQTKIPSGTTAQRAASPTDGMIRYNTDLKQYEGYKDGAWSIFGNGAGGTLYSDTVTATQGQTLITLTTGYVLGGDNLSVYVNGSRQIYNVNYTETTTDSFTFTTGLNAGDLVNYTIGASTSLSVNATSVLYNEGSTGAVDRNVEVKLQESVSVADFGAVGDGVTDDTDAIQSALDSMNSYSIRSMYFPAGNYIVSSTLIPPVGLTSAQFIGASGYDGAVGETNDTLRTKITWNGAVSTTTPVVKFNKANGIVWRGISINCAFKAGYAMQFMSDTLTAGSAKNTVELCNISRATADGIILGEDGVPAAAPGQRQFFNYLFKQLTIDGCARSGIHINEWNADLCVFDQIWVTYDDTGTQDCLNAFWFEYGGQCSEIRTPECGGLNVVVGKYGSGYMIKNGPDSGSAGALGLTVTNAWQEGDGGLYWGRPTGYGDKAFVFTNCKAFTGDTANASVYIDKSGTGQQQYVFNGCSFYSDITIPSATFQSQSLALTGNTFSSGKGVINYSGQKTVNGLYAVGTTTSSGITFPAFASMGTVTIDRNIGAIYVESATQTTKQFTLLITQDGTGSHTINWSGTSFANVSGIPQPTATAGATSAYTFVADGSLYNLVSFKG